jgi:hypothetical protein
MADDVLRLYIWNIGDSKTTFDELRQHLPAALETDAWISNEAAERFGLITRGEIPQDDIERIRSLIGKDPEIAEEFDVER